MEREGQLAVCIGCGCDDNHACPGGCSWLRVDRDAGLGVCSNCSEAAASWDAGDRDPRVNTMARELNRILTAVNKKMHRGSCPGARDLGECAAIDDISPNGSARGFFCACLYIWDKSFSDSKAVADWFVELGASDVTVSAVLYDPENFVKDGVDVNDGVRPWNVMFSLPPVPGMVH